MRIFAPFLGLFTLTLVLEALAYISPFSAIYEKMALRHGRGAYELSKTIVFPTNEGESLSLSERWSVLDEKNMLLKLKGSFKDSLVEAEILYTPKGKVFLDEEGVLKKLLKT